MIIVKDINVNVTNVIKYIANDSATIFTNKFLKKSGNTSRDMVSSPQKKSTKIFDFRLINYN